MRGAAPIGSESLLSGRVATPLRLERRNEHRTMRKRKLLSLTVLVLMTTLVVLAGRLEFAPSTSPYDLPEIRPKHVNPLHPIKPRPQRA